MIDSDRIGHFLSWAFQSYSRKNVKPNFFELNIIYKDICNNFFLSKIKKKIFICDGILGKIFFFSHLINKKFLKKDIYKFYFSTGSAYPSRKNMKNLVAFTKDEIKESKKFFKKYNIDKNFVCLHIRDSAYLKSKKLFSKMKKHTYRDADINNYELLIKFLLKKNYSVIRLGNITNQKIIIKNKNYIDYSNLNYKSDMLEIYIILNCNFFVGVPSGLSSFATFNKTPILHTNLADFGYFDWNHEQFSIFKNFYYKKKDHIKKIKITEIIKKRFHLIDDTRDFMLNDLIVKENTKKELLSAIKEFHHKLQNRDIYYKDSKKQKKFKKLLIKNLPLNKYKKIKSKVCDFYLNKNL
tara:strand:+ start:517 stop:1575 length:1059 start_codon:yes stop_codon:yes gene_type:complete